jgi:DNA-binding NarL/FixJ family response regulator
MSTDILIVDDSLHIQFYIERSLSNNGDFEIIGYASSMELVYDLSEKFSPEIILLTDRFQGELSLEIITALLELNPYAKIIVMTLFSPPSYRKQAEEKGAHGVIMAIDLYTELVPKINSVLKNE